MMNGDRMLQISEKISQKNKPFVGRLFGFRIHPSAIEYQLVAPFIWLRGCVEANFQSVKESILQRKYAKEETPKPHPSQGEPDAKIPATEATDEPTEKDKVA